MTLGSPLVKGAREGEKFKHKQRLGDSGVGGRGEGQTGEVDGTWK